MKPTATASYVVEIVYIEPDFDARRGRPPRPRIGAFVVEADGRDDACERAMEAFRSIARSSSVSWYREVVRVEARRVHGDA